MSGAPEEGWLESEAGEYVIGTLDAQERTSFAARLGTDPSARRAVAEWERRFAGLAWRAGSVTPSPDVWSRIEQSVMVRAGKPLPFRVIEGGGAPARDFRTSRDRWRIGALASGAVAAALLAVVVLRETPRGEEHDTFVAAVNRGGDKPALIVSVDMHTRRVLVRPVAAEAPADHSLQLWFIGAGEAPRSLGVLNDEPATLELPHDAGAAAAATFAVSVEPKGGSTTGGPTGPVVYSGQLVKE